MPTLIQKIHHHLNQNRPISYTDITLFLRQFATLFSSGIPITQCFELLEHTQEKTKLRLILYNIKKDLSAGFTLFQSINKHEKQFDPLTRQLIHIGEQTGKLENILITIADYQEKNLLFRKQILQILFYPTLILTTAFLITFCLLIFVIPRFAELFASTQTELPLLSTCIFYLSHQLQQHLFHLLILISCITAILFHYRQKIKWQQLFFHFPFLHSYFQTICHARFARQLSLTLHAGLPILDALKLTANTITHKKFSRSIHDLQHHVHAGLQLHQAMETTNVFPPLMLQMVKIGEEAGRLDAMLAKLASLLEADLNQFITRFTTLLEPLIMLILGVLIGGLVIAMYLPIFKLGSTFS